MAAKACGHHAAVPVGALALVLWLVGLPAAGAEPPATPAVPALHFEEIGEAAGVRYVHSTRRFTGREKSDVLEMFTDGGAAVAVGDFDGDGREDLFLTDSGEGKPNHLLRNLGGMRFADVAAAAGVAGGNDPLSVVADAIFFDYDNDGREDLLVARFGTPLFYRNLGPDGSGQVHFQEVAQQAGLTSFGNSIAVIAFDYDNDGFLDLLFGNYFQPVNLLALTTPHVLPNNLDAATNGGGVTLWHNVAGPAGSRRFIDTTRQAGLAHHTGWTLDVGHGDLNGDGWPDVYLACDYGTDRLFLNRGDGTFADVTEKAIGWDTRKGMNVDIADYDRDGTLDVYVTNITDDYMKECNMLWHNNGDGTFLDVSRETGTCDTDWGWAAKFADLDNDGWDDLFVVNGLRSRGEEDYIPVLLEMIITPNVDFTDIHSYPDIGDRTWSGYQKKRLFHNQGDGTFREMGAAAGVANDLDGRGIAVADLDGDGRLDLVQTNANQPSLLYRNRSTGTGHWVELVLEGRSANRDAIGARVVLEAGGQSHLREVNGGNGYAGASSRRLHFGLGAATVVSKVTILWPGGGRQVLAPKDGKPPVPLDASTRIVEAETAPAP